MSPFYLQMAIRAVLAFAAVLVIARVLEKGRTGQLSLYEYLAVITIGFLAGGIVLQTGTSPGPLLVALFVFAFLAYVVRLAALKSRPARKLLVGEPALVIQNGKILEKNMEKLHYNTDDLLMQLRSQGFFNISDVEFAVLEPNGTLSVQLKTHKMPATREDLKIESQYQGLGSELIIDGEVIYQNLEQNDLDEAWLINELNKQRIKKLGEVELAILDTDGSLYVDKKEDEFVHYTRIQDDPGE
ncbi:MAG: DUF421 domain-containing protein [Thermacetogeniaceae bacterium]